jgi:hypothetical protein
MAGRPQPRQTMLEQHSAEDLRHRTIDAED